MKNLEEIKKLFDQANFVMEEHERKQAANFARLIESFDQHISICEKAVQKAQGFDMGHDLKEKVV